MADGSRRKRRFIPVGARSRIWEQMRNTQPCRPDLKTHRFLRHERAQDWRNPTNLKEFYAVYKGVEFKIYDASPMFTDDRKYQLKCRAGA